MNQFLKRAKELESQLQTDRRYLHQHAEAGEDLPNTTRYVMERLREIGLTPTEICPSGVTALLRAQSRERFFFFVQIWMLFQCRRTTILHLKLKPMQHTTVDMIFTQQCCYVSPDAI